MTAGSSAPHLVLVGLMGAGKTTVGQRCAALLERPFVDTDEVVETVAHMSVAEIFATEGEGGFRTRERDAVTDVCASPQPAVIACGGGAVLDAENRARLRSSGVVVWLRAQPATLASRVGDGEGRPLLAGSPAATLARLATLRSAAYEAAAHCTVDIDGYTVDAVVGEVLARYHEAVEARA